MIDEIVELILKEARARKGNSLANNIFVVQTEVEDELIKIRYNLRKEERRKKKNENKRGAFTHA